MINKIAVRRPIARCANAMSESVPPSPLLSICMTRKTYFNVTTIISAQNMSETTP